MLNARGIGIYLQNKIYLIYLTFIFFICQLFFVDFILIYCIIYGKEVVLCSNSAILGGRG